MRTFNQIFGNKSFKDMETKLDFRELLIIKKTILIKVIIRSASEARTPGCGDTSLSADSDPLGSP